MLIVCREMAYYEITDDFYLSKLNGSSSDVALDCRTKYNGKDIKIKLDSLPAGTSFLRMIVINGGGGEVKLDDIVSISRWKKKDSLMLTIIKPPNQDYLTISVFQGETYYHHLH